MKSFLTLSLLSGFLFSTLYIQAQKEIKVKTKEDKTKIKGKDNDISNSKTPGNSDIQGVYSLEKQIINDGTKDSLIQNKQLKIYTDRYMIYAHPLSGDSLGDYGIGTYQVQNGKVMEYVFYTGSGGAHNDTFQLDIKKSPGVYSQVIAFPADSQGRKYVLTEDYKIVGKSITTPLDGAWKLTQVMYTPKNGTTSTDNNPTQFKVYQSGHFIWGNSTKDSATNKPISTFGYGTFDMIGKNQARELNTNSTFVSMLVDKPVTLKLEFISKDDFKQTILFPSGDLLVEAYHRLK